MNSVVRTKIASELFIVFVKGFLQFDKRKAVLFGNSFYDIRIFLYFTKTIGLLIYNPTFYGVRLDQNKTNGRQAF